MGARGFLDKIVSARCVQDVLSAQILLRVQGKMRVEEVKAESRAQVCGEVRDGVCIRAPFAQDQTGKRAAGRRKGDIKGGESCAKQWRGLNAAETKKRQVSEADEDRVKTQDEVWDEGVR